MRSWRDIARAPLRTISSNSACAASCCAEFRDLGLARRQFHDLAVAFLGQHAARRPFDQRAARPRAAPGARAA